MNFSLLVFSSLSTYIIQIVFKINLNIKIIEYYEITNQAKLDNETVKVSYNLYVNNFIHFSVVKNMILGMTSSVHHTNHLTYFSRFNFTQCRPPMSF